MNNVLPLRIVCKISSVKAVISWFIIPINYRYNPRKPQILELQTKLANYGAPPCANLMDPKNSSLSVLSFSILYLSILRLQLHVGPPWLRNRDWLLNKYSNNYTWLMVMFMVYTYLSACNNGLRQTKTKKHHVRGPHIVHRSFRSPRFQLGTVQRSIALQNW